MASEMHSSNDDEVYAVLGLHGSGVQGLVASKRPAGSFDSGLLVWPHVWFSVVDRQAGKVRMPSHLSILGAFLSP